jgi:hypothetical protein
MVENPKGNDSQERALVRGLAKRAKANMENHFKTAMKYKDDPEIKALLGEKEEIKEEENGKKSKR